ncbi:hypothetical protein FBU30_006358 [Linnemannia zychae]|nr:hypothetical protein FBU30_006358 [Linnemannia zychae]
MTTATTPVANLADSAKDRSSAINNAKQHTDYTDRVEPRSLAADYTTNGSYSSSRQYQQGHYSQNSQTGNGAYSEDYYSNHQQDHYSNTHSHHSSTSSSSSSHYSHSANGSSYLPPPIQTATFAGHDEGKNGDSSLYPQQHHGHAQSFVSPTSPASSAPLSSNVAQQAYTQGHHEYDHPQSHSYHSHHSYHTSSYGQEHHQHPLGATNYNENNIRAKNTIRLRSLLTGNDAYSLGNQILVTAMVPVFGKLQKMDGFDEQTEALSHYEV